MAIWIQNLPNSKRDHLFVKINLFDDIFKQKLRILVKFAESPAIFNEQMVWVRSSGVEKWSFSLKWRRKVKILNSKDFLPTF